ncbi:MAG: adenosylcobinamide kinase/adenosylcobinamide phosphate guanyltransferase [Ignavibacteria bacterium GWB2_35_6b]|nr:MAG: adenosylcobinamide kinase/adenosylcobinamide phosphate guanyltransferase [Ignavibacteria bacterium GWB2_35_6b]
MIIFITGGERSGKSSYAQKLALQFSDKPIYVATSRIWDDDFKSRVDQHRNERDKNWSTIEEGKNIGELNIENKTAVIDCVTLWLTNFYTDTNNDVDKSLMLAKEQINKLKTKAGNFIIISNEIGMGVHAATHTARKFVELQGWVNQYIGAAADEAYLMVSGIPLRLK